MTPHRWLLAVTALALATPLAAQDVRVSGEVRPRYELRDPAATGGLDEFTSMRVRAAISADVHTRVGVFVELQDVRLWGEETSTVGDFRADNFDLHQGYVRIRDERLAWLTTTLGRQEMPLGGGRLVSHNPWAQQGRVFDGVRLDARGAFGTAALFAHRTGDATAALATGASTAADAELYGAYATLERVGPGALDVYWLLDHVEGQSPSDEHAVGARFHVSGPVTARLEATRQLGTRDGEDVAAFMFGGRVGRTFANGRLGATLWYDYLSGDTDPADGETRVFSTLYATGHKYYGFADVFTNIPVHTGALGLTDAAVKLRWVPTESTSLNVDLHRFSVAEQAWLSGSHLADELDLTLSHRYTPTVTATAGLSFVMQDAPLGQLGRLSQDMTWLYLMLSASF